MVLVVYDQNGKKTSHLKKRISPLAAAHRKQIHHHFDQEKESISGFGMEFQDKVRRKGK